MGRNRLCVCLHQGRRISTKQQEWYSIHQLDREGKVIGVAVLMAIPAPLVRDIPDKSYQPLDHNFP